MKIVRNPQSRATIQSFLFKKRIYGSDERALLPIGQMKPFPDEFADALIGVYDFLAEESQEGKFICKYGDYVSESQTGCNIHEKKHEKRIAAGEEKVSDNSEEFITPQEEIEAEKQKQIELVTQDGIPVGEGTDKDGVGWYGAGVEEELPTAVGDEF